LHADTAASNLQCYGPGRFEVLILLLHERIQRVLLRGFEIDGKWRGKEKRRSGEKNGRRGLLRRPSRRYGSVNFCDVGGGLEVMARELSEGREEKTWKKMVEVGIVLPPRLENWDPGRTGNILHRRQNRGETLRKNRDEAGRRSPDYAFYRKQRSQERKRSKIFVNFQAPGKRTNSAKAGKIG